MFGHDDWFFFKQGCFRFIFLFHCNKWQPPLCKHTSNTLDTLTSIYYYLPYRCTVLYFIVHHVLSTITDHWPHWQNCCTSLLFACIMLVARLLITITLTVLNLQHSSTFTIVLTQRSTRSITRHLRELSSKMQSSIGEETKDSSLKPKDAKGVIFDIDGM